MIDIIGKNVRINATAEKAGLMNGRNDIVNWTAFSKMNRNVVFQAKQAPGNWISDSFNVIDDQDTIDFWVNQRKRVSNADTRYSSE